jgi:hypothetical protein
MNRSVGAFLWQISVALYLIANGVLGLSRYSGGDFQIMYRAFFGRGDLTSALVFITSIIAFIAGIGIVIELLNIEFPFLNSLLFIVAIVWIVYIVIEVITWLTGKGDYTFKKDLFYVLQKLAVHIMVLASLLVSSKRFE